MLKESVHRGWIIVINGGKYHKILNNATIIILCCCSPQRNISGIEINTFFRFNCVFMRNENTLNGKGYNEKILIIPSLSSGLYEKESLCVNQ